MREIAEESSSMSRAHLDLHVLDWSNQQLISTDAFDFAPKGEDAIQKDSR